jgi:hypothetical protein
MKWLDRIYRKVILGYTEENYQYYLSIKENEKKSIDQLKATNKEAIQTHLHLSRLIAEATIQLAKLKKQNDSN